ncbi:MAG: SBBP repeat-containing protein [Pseudomonadota bacterium]
MPCHVHPTETRPRRVSLTLWFRRHRRGTNEQRSHPGSGIAVDSSGNVYVTGYTYSTDFPASGGFDTALGGTMDAFVTKVSSAGSSLAWSSFLGGTSSVDSGRSIAVDSAASQMP